MNKAQFLIINGFCWVDIPKIRYFQSSGRKSKIILENDQEIPLEMTLTDCWKVLPQNHFCLINRYTMVNLLYVFRLINTSNNRGRVALVNGEVFDVTRRRKNNLLQLMANL